MRTSKNGVEIEEILDEEAEHFARESQVETVYANGDCANGDATMFALDALGGTIRNIKVNVHQDGASAGNISIVWKVTSFTSPLTFTERGIPVVVAVNPGAASNIRGEFGDLPEGLQLQCIFRSAGDDTGDDYYAELTSEV